MSQGKSTGGGDGMMVWIIIGLMVLLLIGVGLFYVAWVYDGVRQTARDVAIIVLATFQMIGAVLTVVMIVALLYAIRKIQHLISHAVIPKVDATMVKVDEVLDHSRAISGNVRESVETTTTTTVFVAEQVVSPVIRVSSLIAGVRAAVKSLARHDADSHEHSSP